MSRLFSAAIFALALTGGCSPLQSNPSVAPGAQKRSAPAIQPEAIVVPFAGSSTLGTFDAATGRELRLIAGGKTEIASPLGSARDSAGNLYVSSTGPALGIYEFKAGANGNKAPIASDKGVTADGLASDGQHVYLTDPYTGTISEYAADPLGSAPIATVSGRKSTLCSTFGIALDRSKNVYVTQQGLGSNCVNDVLEFAPLKAGNQDPAPIRTIAGYKTLLSSAQGIAVDAAGSIYVADSQLSKVLEFKRWQKGDEAPAATFGTGGYAYYGVAVDASHHLYAAAPNASDSFGQIDVFEASDPTREPIKSLQIGSKKGQRNPNLISL